MTLYIKFVHYTSILVKSSHFVLLSSLCEYTRSLSEWMNEIFTVFLLMWEELVESRIAYFQFRKNIQKKTCTNEKKKNIAKGFLLCPLTTDLKGCFGDFIWLVAWSFTMFVARNLIVSYKKLQCVSVYLLTMQSKLFSSFFFIWLKVMSL